MKFKKVVKPYNFKKTKVQGLTNDLLILNDKYFVKQSVAITKPFLDWKNQVKVIKKVKNAKFTLPILEAKISEDKLWTLMLYYPKITTLPNTKITHDILKTWAKLVQELHEVRTKNAKIKRWNPIKQLNLYCDLIKPDKFTAEFQFIKFELTNWLKNYRPQNRVLAHNDLVIDNFVCLGKKWYLIDWDFASINDRLFDIASFASETLTKEADINYWYQLFEVKTSELKIINNWIKYQNLIWYHWASYLYQQTHNKTYQTIAKIKLANLFNK